MPRIATANKDTIAEAAALIKAGEIVALPTETVYGLGADATNGEAIAKIFEAKNRPSFNPLIIHIAKKDDPEKYVVMNENAKLLASYFWPGALTMILPRQKDCPISELCSVGLPTLAIRMPAHKTAQKLLEKAGCPIAAPSANKSGTISPTTPALVAHSLGNKVHFILADGSCEIGLESTVIDLSGKKPVILRPGGITPEDISRVLEQDVRIAQGDADAPKSPGLTLRHYAPKVPVRLNAVDLKQGEALLAFGSIKFMGIKGGGAAKDLPATAIRNLSETQDLNEAAANLFRMLHELDQPAHKAIAIMPIPEKSLGLAINDRLQRAAKAQSDS